MRYPFRTAETLASLLDRPDVTLDRWDAITQRRPVVALAGADAHARAGWMDDDVQGYRQGWFLSIPSYDASLRTFAMRVELERPLVHDAAADAAHVIAALKRGSAYSAVDAIASPAVLEFSGNSRGRQINRETSFRRPPLPDVHGSHECSDRRSNRASKRRPPPDPESLAGAHD